MVKEGDFGDISPAKCPSDVKPFSPPQSTKYLLLHVACPCIHSPWSELPLATLTYSVCQAQTLTFQETASSGPERGTVQAITFIMKMVSVEKELVETSVAKVSRAPLV